IAEQRLGEERHVIPAALGLTSDLRHVAHGHRGIVSGSEARLVHELLGCRTSTERYARALSMSIRTRRRIFPDADFGIWSTNSRWRTRLWGATRSATQPMIASAVVTLDASSGFSTTNAFGTSPASSSALRTTATSRTAGCVTSNASSSAGATCSPLYLINSLVRSTMKKNPSPSTYPTSPV